MSGKRSQRITGPRGTIRGGTALPSEVAAFVTIGLVFRRDGDDVSGEYDNMTGALMLQADGDEHLMARLEQATQLGQLQPAMDALMRAVTDALGGDVMKSSPTIAARSGRVGRA